MTLDDVIKAFDLCFVSKGDCAECPYYGLKGNKSCWQKMNSDVLYHLCEYRDLSRDGLVADGMNEMLYPCPDCGGIAKIEVSEAYRDDVRIVHSFRAVCGGCGGSGAASFDQTEAVIHWNESAAKKIGNG